MIRLDFLPEPGDVHVDGSRLQTVRIEPPDSVQQFVTIDTDIQPVNDDLADALGLQRNRGEFVQSVQDGGALREGLRAPPASSRVREGYRLPARPGL